MPNTRNPNAVRLEFAPGSLVQHNSDTQGEHIVFGDLLLHE